MFVIDLTYIKPLEEVDKHLQAHRDFLKTQYEAGVFVVSGRKNPPVGGVIVARSETREALESLLENDPFKKEGVADYRITEFETKMFHPDFTPFAE